VFWEINPMAVFSGSLNGVFLTEEDAERFEKQIKEGTVSKAATDAFVRGRDLLAKVNAEQAAEENNKK
jgi:hypothetical protein